MEMKATLYYREKLDQYDQKIYDALIKSCTKFERKFETQIPHSSFKNIIQAVHNDCPSLFYVDFSRFSYENYSVKSYVHMNYLYQKEEAGDLLKYCEKWAGYIIKSKPKKVRDQELALWLHDVILNNVTYGDRYNHESHTIVGVFRKKIAVCEGIALAYKFLCDLNEIPCIFVEGSLHGSPHGWNMIWLAQGPSFVDVTNDVSFGKKFERSYFLRSSDQMPGYVWDRSLIPECRVSNKSNGYVTAKNQKEFLKLLKTVKNFESINIYLDFGYPLSDKEIERLIQVTNFVYPLLAIYQVSYSQMSQMVFVKK